MATRSTIAIRNTNGTVTGTYCHWDGGFWHVGPMLLKHYNTEEKIRELLSFGHISFLDERIHPSPDSNHHFDNAEPGVTVFYGRDRGEKNVDNWSAETWEEFVRDTGEQFNYIFEHGTWHVGNKGVLEEEMKKEKEAA